MNPYDKKHDVLVIDKDTNRVQEIKDKVTRAVVADATDIKTLETLAIKEMVPDQLNMIPTVQYVLKDGDILILLGANDKLNLLREKE
jgi:Trk K+ transport system NAD-binding subunit